MQGVTQLLWAGFNYNSTHSVTDKFAKFAHDRSLVPNIGRWVQHGGRSLIEWFSAHWHDFATWLAVSWHAFFDWFKQPHIVALILAFCITFSVVLFLLGLIGFNPIGIGGGTLAAAFQSCMYGGFTPAGGIFATLTSMAMLSTLMPVEVGIATMTATIVTLIVWAAGAGR